MQYIQCVYNILVKSKNLEYYFKMFKNPNDFLA